MSQLASSVFPGTSPSAVSALVHERLCLLARHYDDAAEHLAGLASRIASLAETHGSWEGPGARSFRARADRHEQELRDASHRCRETAQLVRTGAAALAERVAAVESIAQVGAPMAAALSTVLAWDSRWAMLRARRGAGRRDRGGADGAGLEHRILGGRSCAGRG